MDIAQKRSHGLSCHPWKSIVPHILCLHHLHTCHSPSWGWRGHCLSLKTLLSTHLKYCLLNTSKQKISRVLSSKDGHKILISHTCKLIKLLFCMFYFHFTSKTYICWREKKKKYIYIYIYFAYACTKVEILPMHS